MPQMAPMNWLPLYIFFSAMFMLFNFLNYFMFLKTTNQMTSLINIKTKKLNWKW